MKNKMYTLDEIKNQAIPIAKKYNIISLSQFDSYARDEQRNGSNLDFLIVANDKMGLLEYVEFYQELEKVFGCYVDVVTSEIEDKDFLSIIEKNKKVLYAAQR